MNDAPWQKAEVQFVREQLKRFLNDRSFDLVLESDSQQDGWRGEFIGHVNDEDVICLAHKPMGAPFASICLRVSLPSYSDQDDAKHLMEIASDFDIAVYSSSENKALIHLASRLLLSGINDADFEFTFHNLLYCRDAVLNHFGLDESE